MEIKLSDQGMNLNFLQISAYCKKGGCSKMFVISISSAVKNYDSFHLYSSYGKYRYSYITGILYVVCEVNILFLADFKKLVHLLDYSFEFCGYIKIYIPLYTCQYLALEERGARHTQRIGRNTRCQA